jgi:hypothetical protein
MSFRITGLPADQFAPLFALSDAELAAKGAVRQIAMNGAPATPAGSASPIHSRATS